MLQPTSPAAGIFGEVFLEDAGEWLPCDWHLYGFVPKFRYRIRPDYQPSVGYVDYELFCSERVWEYTHLTEGTCCSEMASRYKGFIGYISDRGEVMSSRVM